MSVAGEEDDVSRHSIGVNTDELSKEELQRLVDNNKELQEEDVSNIEHEAKDSTIDMNTSHTPQRLKDTSALKSSSTKQELIEELNEKDKIFDLLVKSNTELKSKIAMSTIKYNEILSKIKEKESEQSEAKLTHQIKEMEKEINAHNAQTEHYKKMIDQLKNKIEFKSNLERAFNLQNILKQETMRNNELKNQLNAIMRVNGVQMKYINNYDKENQITEKIDILKSEIKQTKESLKDYMDRFAKQDKFIRMIHEKILSLEMMMKKLKEPKVEKTKLFTKEELKETLEVITQLKNQIRDNRNQLNTITKANDDKMHQLLSQNKQIENDYKENEKLNKMLIYKKNELKRNIKNSNAMSIPIGNYKKQQIVLPEKKKEQIDCAGGGAGASAGVGLGGSAGAGVGGNKNPSTRKLFAKNPNKQKASLQEQELEIEQKVEDEGKAEMPQMNQQEEMSENENENENNFDANDSNDQQNE